MTDTTTNLVPEGIRHDTPALHDLSERARIEHHRKQLHSIGFHQGLDGVKAYKRQHPEAAPIPVNIQALAFLNKPAGYNDAILGIAERWLTDDEAVARTNKADVERLNARFGEDRFNPANHFSKPLSPGRLAKLKELFRERGVHLDTGKANTLSKVKAAAKAARGRISADRPFGSVGVVSGKRLILGGRSFALDEHHGHDCVRVSINGDRLRVRLDVLEAIIGGLSGGDNPSPTYCLCNMGELAPEPERPDFDLLADEQPVELAPASHTEPVGPAPASAPPSLGDRIAALRAALPQSQHSTACADAVDPLAL